MFECTTCKKVLKKESALVQHCKDKGHPYVAPVAKATPVRTRASTASLPTTSAVASSTAAVASSSTAKVLIECALCSTSFNDKTSYDQHIASKHPPKPFKCAPCGVEFSSAEALSIHYKHFAVHPKCPQCGSAFIDSTQLKLHQAIHPKCSQCGSIFLNRAHLEEVSTERFLPLFPFTRPGLTRWVNSTRLLPIRSSGARRADATSPALQTATGTTPYLRLIQTASFAGRVSRTTLRWTRYARVRAVAMHSHCKPTTCTP